MTPDAGGTGDQLQSGKGVRSSQVFFQQRPAPGNVGSTPTLIRAPRWYDLELPLATASLLLADFDVHAFDSGAFAQAQWPASIRSSVKKRQAEFFAGRWVAMQALTSLGVTVADLPIGHHRAPIWPEKTVGSITHTSTQVAAAVLPVSACRGIGIDLEPIVDDEMAQILLSQVVDAHELSVLRGSELPWLAAITIAFSAKESFFKGSFAAVGDYFGFDAVRLTAVDAVRASLQLTLVTTLAPCLSEGQSFAVRYGILDTQTVLTAFAW